MNHDFIVTKNIKKNQKCNLFSAERGRKASSSGKQKDSVLGVLCLGIYFHNKLST